MTRRAVRAVAGVLMVVALLGVATLLVRLLVDDGQGSEVTDATSASAPDSVVVSASAAADATAAAERAAGEVLGYSWRTLDEDATTARLLLADELREQYDASIARTADETMRTRTVVEASPVASSVVSVTDSEAKVLLFVNERTTASDLEEPQVELNRVVLTLQRVPGGWLVSEIDAL